MLESGRQPAANEGLGEWVIPKPKVITDAIIIRQMDTFDTLFVMSFVVMSTVYSSFDSNA